jgi:hypothetical protein
MFAMVLGGSFQMGTYYTFWYYLLSLFVIVTKRLNNSLNLNNNNNDSNHNNNTGYSLCLPGLSILPIGKGTLHVNENALITIPIAM